MRLICPNCGAQYDVADDAIPPGGRDVQCSNCQVSWFQTEKPTIPGRDTSQLITPRIPEPAEAALLADVGSEPDPQIEAAPEQAADAPAEEEPATAQITEPQRKPLDDAVANILREEAALSTPVAPSAPVVPAAPAAPAVAAPPVAPAAAAPIAEPPATEAAAPAQTVTVDETRQRIAQMTAEEGGTPTRASDAPAARGSASADEAHLRTVPSINEINATLRARAQANDASGLTEAEKEQAVQRKGFRRGFFWVLIILAILVLPYVFAEQITENLPQTREFMASYMIMVDKLRLTLSEFINGLRAE